MVEIYVAYISRQSAFKIVTPNKTITTFVNGNCNKAVLAALKATHHKRVALLTKSNIYELILNGKLHPKTESEKALSRLLVTKSIKFGRIDEATQNELIEFIKKESARISLNKERRKALKKETNEQLEVEVKPIEKPEKLEDVVFEIDINKEAEEKVLPEDVNIKEETGEVVAENSDASDPFN